MTTILFPTDFSDCAMEAQEAAFTLAKLFDAELRVIHVIDDTIFKWESQGHFLEQVDVLPLQTQPLRIEQEDSVKNQFLNAIDSIVKGAEERGIKIEAELMFGNPVKVILAEAKKIDADFIVMGTHGASGFKEAFTGSITQGVAKHASCPVLSLRKLPYEGTFNVKNLVYASNFKVESDNDNLAFVKVFARYFDASITLLFVNTPHYFEETNETLNRIEKVAQDHKLDKYSIEIYNHFTVEDGVLTYANNNNVDLIAVSNHHYGLLKSIVEFRTAEVLVNHAKVPVLTLNV